jgi:hypothetical protein
VLPSLPGRGNFLVLKADFQAKDIIVVDNE